MFLPGCLSLFLSPWILFRFPELSSAAEGSGCQILEGEGHWSAIFTGDVLAAHSLLIFRLSYNHTALCLQWPGALVETLT